MKLTLGKKECGENLPPLMFAEEGQANQGDFSLALKMAEIAASVGADGIEFQFAFAEDLYARTDPGYELYLKREFSTEQISKLIKTAKSLSLIFQAVCLSPRIVEACVSAGADVLCINAMDLNNPVMLKAVSKSGLPFWLATLMGTMEEIDWAVSYINQFNPGPFGILHGQHIMASDHSIGVPPEMAQLDCINMIRERYNVVTGFIDHTQTVQMPAIAVAKGASLVMKHLAPEQRWRGPDWGVCLSPDEWKKSCNLLRYAGFASGNSKDLSQAEVKDRGLQRRSLFIAHELPAGHCLQEQDLLALRPGGGLNPREMNMVVGKRLKKTLPAQHMISMDDLYYKGDI